MNYLPNKNGLSIELLSQSFDDTTNSYKFYWFLSILDRLKEKRSFAVTFKELSLRMVSNVWYPLDYFKLSFGTQDSFKNIAKLISSHVSIESTPGSPQLLTQLKNKLDTETLEKIQEDTTKTLKRWVAYRFLRPFFKKELIGVKDHIVNQNIIKLANTRGNVVPYTFSEHGILLNPEWADYFQTHQQILRGYIQFHLLKFLQKHNPNVIGLTEKLEKPIIRNLTLAKEFWSIYLKSTITDCIYSNQPLNGIAISLDHFIPWSYIAHDQIWNIIPTTKSINSSKSDMLPSLKSYIDKFCKLQYGALKFHLNNDSAKLIDNYYQLTGVTDLSNITLELFSAKLRVEIENHVRVAKSLGFVDQYIWKDGNNKLA